VRRVLDGGDPLQGLPGREAQYSHLQAVLPALQEEIGCGVSFRGSNFTTWGAEKLEGRIARWGGDCDKIMVAVACCLVLFLSRSVIS
jgi:hypothetical protein